MTSMLEADSNLPPLIPLGGVAVVGRWKRHGLETTDLNGIGDPLVAYGVAPQYESKERALEACLPPLHREHLSGCSRSDDSANTFQTSHKSRFKA
jgi:hypothetical protein